MWKNTLIINIIARYTKEPIFPYICDEYHGCLCKSVEIVFNKSKIITKVVIENTQIKADVNIVFCIYSYVFKWKLIST